jgi:PhzF family phenazine biosynthesis protein
MQVVALEMNLSETAFVWKIPRPKQESLSTASCGSDNSDVDSSHYRIRYFTPIIEVDLCGHATLASAAILCKIHNVRHVVFYTNHNVVLRATQSQVINAHCAQIAMTFPTQMPTEIHTTHDDRVEVDQLIKKSFPTITSDKIVYVGLVHGLSDLFIEVQYDAFLHDTTKRSDVNIRAMTEWDGYQRGIILCCASAGGSTNTINDTDTDNNNDSKMDFYSRFFGPKAGIDEDPVTGSAHCALAPYFGQKLHKLELIGQQSSARGGIIHCALSNDGTNVTLSGTAVTTASGTLWM